MSLSITETILDQSSALEVFQNWLENQVVIAESRIKRALSFTASSIEDTNRAAELYKESRNELDRIEVARKMAIKPYQEAVYSVNDGAKALTEKLKREQAIYLEHIDAWKAKEREAQKEREADAKEMQEALQLDVAPYVKEDLSTIRTAGVRAQEREEIEVELVDISKVPLEYLLINEKALKAVAKAGIRNIPGINFKITTKTQIVRR